MNQQGQTGARWGWRILLIFPGLPILVALALWFVVNHWGGQTGPRPAAGAPAVVQLSDPHTTQPPKAQKQPQAPPAAPAPIAPPPPAPEIGQVKVSAGTLRRVDVPDQSAKGTQGALVWLPPGYEDAANSTRDYPVLYMYVGPQLFDDSRSSSGEWKADETAAKLIQEGKIEPLIIVAITHSVVLSPDDMVNKVKPAIESQFRIRRGPESTAIGGAGVSAAFVFPAAVSHPEVFGKILAESAPLAANDRALWKSLAAAKAWPGKVYFGMGGKDAGTMPADSAENANNKAAAGAFRELLAGRGFNDSTLKVVVEPEAEENVEAWGKRFGPALEFLFPAPSAAPAAPARVPEQAK